MAIPLALRIDAALPQTQCTRCGFDGCRPYAEAIAGGQADINRCPPGGPDVIAALAQLTGATVKPLDAARGAHGPLLVAIIDEAACIGCTLCIAACPVDAIIGAPKRMHAILPSLCSGCELCVAPCPVDCITMGAADRQWTNSDAAASRTRHDARNARLARGERIAHRKRAEPPKVSASPSLHAPVIKAETPDPIAAPVDAERLARAGAVAAALARARARRRAAT